MKKLFSDEVAQELGYQKWWPEKSDWVKAIFWTLAFIAFIYVGTFYFLDKTGYLERQNQKNKEYRSSITEWCKTHSEKTLAETEKCLNF